MNVPPPSPRLTILTACWNRVDLLRRLHASIAAQHVPPGQVEWLVIDDGSTDQTEAEMHRLSGLAGPVALRYLRQPHGGKHRALNTGFAVSRGDWIAIVDSDDWCRDGAMPAVLELLENLVCPKAFAVILPVIVPRARRQYHFRRPNRALSYVRRVNEEPPFDSTLIFRRSTEGLRFPEFEGEDFLSESSLMLRLGRDRDVWLSNQVFIKAEYQIDGISANILHKRMTCPIGACHVYQLMLQCPLRLPLRLRALANYGRFWWHARTRRKRPQAPESFAQWLSLLPGAAFCVRDHIVMAARH